MGIEDAIDKTVANVKDAADEAKHRAEAEAERKKREMAGDQMTVGEKLGSVVNEKKNDTEAGIDKAKRDLRNKS